MTEYIIWESDKTETTDYLGVKHGVSHFEKREEIVRCRDCKHATISSLGYVKYCEKFVLPDEDGYGADAQVNLPLDFFCAWGERRDA